MKEQSLHCIGCGIKIQSENPDVIGYAPQSALEKEQLICQRCFRLKHYNEIQDVSFDNNDLLKMLHELGQRKGLIVLVVDIFDFNGSWITGLQRFVGSNPVLLIGNKEDVLPKSTKRNKLILWMKKQARELGLKPVDVLLVSAVKGHYMEEALTAMEYYRKGEDIFVVGCTNVGKSTFINRIIKDLTGEKNVITTSHFPGTTLDMIEIPLSDGKRIVDTPGLINDHQMAHYIQKQDLKIITPKKEMKPIVFQLNEQQTLFFGGLARLDYLKGGRRPFVCYVSNGLKIHRTKLENADSLYEKQAGELLQPPRKQELEQFPAFVRHEFSLKMEKTDIVFSGLGWITINEPGATVAAYAPKGVSVLLRSSLI